MMIRSGLQASPDPEKSHRVTLIKPRKGHDYPGPRPQTTPVINRSHPNASLLSSIHSGRSQLVNQRVVGAVEEHLQAKHPSDMTNYLRNKFRTLVAKRQEDYLHQGSLSNTIEMADLDNTSKLSAVGPLEQYFTLVKQDTSRVHVEKGVEEGYLLTAKERIERLIDMKKETELRFSQWQSKITEKVAQEEGKRARRTLLERPKRTIDQDWDKKWRQQSASSSKRYRNRLVRRHSKQTTPFFDLTH